MTLLAAYGLRYGRAMATQKQTSAKTRRREEVIELRKKGLGNAEIAERLGISNQAVATLFYRAKQEGMTVPESPYRRRRKDESGTATLFAVRPLPGSCLVNTRK